MGLFRTLWSGKVKTFLSEWALTGGEASSLFICLDATKFVLLSFFSLIKTIYSRVFEQTTSNDAKSPLDVRRSQNAVVWALLYVHANSQTKGLGRGGKRRRIRRRGVSRYSYARLNQVWEKNRLFCSLLPHKIYLNFILSPHPPPPLVSRLRYNLDSSFLVLHITSTHLAIFH